MSKLTWQPNANIENSVHQQKKKLILKNKKIIITFFLALLSTLLQFFFIKSCNILSSNKNSNQKYAIIVASTNIKKGESLSEENTKLAYFGLDEAKNKFILNSEFRQYLGHSLKINIDQGTPILKDIIITDNYDNSLSEKIPPGKRFYALDVDLASLSSVVKVGDMVDIIAHMDINGFGRATETILKRIKIIGIGNNFLENTGKSSDDNVLSFYLTPEEIKIISFMKPYSQFTIAVRNPNDHDVSDNDVITFNKFIQNEKIQKIFQNEYFKIIEGAKVNNSTHEVKNVENY